MSLTPGRAISYLFDGRYGPRERQIPRWIFLRCLGLIYFSAFYSWFFQVRGLIGPDGILPAAQYLNAVAHSLGPLRFWLAPTLLWFSASNGMLLAITAIGLLFALLAICDVWPRVTFFVCFVCYLSLVAAAGLSIGLENFHRQASLRQRDRSRQSVGTSADDAGASVRHRPSHHPAALRVRAQEGSVWSSVRQRW